MLTSGCEMKIYELELWKFLQFRCISIKICPVRSTETSHNLVNKHTIKEVKKNQRTLLRLLRIEKKKIGWENLCLGCEVY